MQGKTPVISVVIPALNEERFIGRCLASLLRIEFPRERWEAIVVDNGSSDGTLAIAQSFSTRGLNLTVTQKRDVNVSGLRNLGARLARGGRLIFLDADCEVAADWLSRSAAAAGDGLTGAPYTVPPQSSWVARIWAEHEQRRRGAAPSFLSSHNMHIGRELFLAIGGFDERLETNEDYELCERLRAAGHPVSECAPLSVVHWGSPQTLRQFWRRESWHGRDVLGVFLEDIRKRRNVRAVGFAAYTLACLAALAAAMVAGAASGNWTPALLVVAALLAPSFLLSVREAATGGRWANVPGLAVLFLTYGLARAVALVLPRNRSARKQEKVAAA